MKKCLECGKEFDDSLRTGEKWDRAKKHLGCMVDQCDPCLQKFLRGVRDD